MVQVKVESSRDPYRQQVNSRGHSWQADEPTDKGGGDAAPTPFELLLSSIGACMITTAQMYASRKQWPLERIEVRLEHRRISAEECMDCDTKEGMVSEIPIEVEIKGRLSKEQTNRIFEIAGRCPIKKALEGEVKFRPQLLD